MPRPLRHTSPPRGREPGAGAGLSTADWADRPGASSMPAPSARSTLDV